MNNPRSAEHPLGSPTDPGGDYVQKLKGHLADAENEQETLNIAIKETKDHYNSAAMAADRLRLPADKI